MAPDEHTASESASNLEPDPIFAILLDWLAGSDKPTETGFVQLCQQHPEHVGPLRDRWQRLQSAVSRFPGLPSAAAMSTSLLIDGVASANSSPQVLLEQGSVSKGSTGDLLRRLVEHRASRNRYAGAEFLDQGAMGLIEKIWDNDLQRHLVRKVMKIRSGDDVLQQTQRLARFLEEAQITSQLHHPGIVPVHDLGIDESGRAYFTMPLIRGITLDEVFVARTQGDPEWSLARCLNLLIKVCEALAFAHSRNVVHRDVKPSNVMVGRFGEVYLMDWGLARVLGRPDLHNLRLAESSIIHSSREAERLERPDSPLVTLDGQVLGTPAYMAPEQANSRIDQIGPWTDIYSVGAMLYHLLAGEMPYESMCARPSPRTVLDLVRRGPPRRLADLGPNVPRALVMVCEQAMARNPRERYPDAQAMAREIEAYLGDRPTEHASAWETLHLAIRRNRRLVATAAAALLVIIGGLASFILYQDVQAERRQRALDFMSSQALIDQVEDVYPIHPDSCPRMQRWLDRATDVLRRQDRYRAEHEASAATSVPVGQERAKMLDNLERIRALFPRLESDLDKASRLHEETIEKQQAAWKRAAESVAQNPSYGGLSLRPQIGLVPLRSDPQTELYEFLVWASGERPAIDAGGGYVLTPDTGIILVLIPGGVAKIGTPKEWDRRDNEGRHDVQLEAFFFSKHEVSQAAWKRVMGNNPSGHRAGYPYKEKYKQFNWLHPVEQVSWYDSLRLARHLGLQLPTEVQWEYACGGGDNPPYYCGSDPNGLKDHENVLDQTANPGKEDAAPWKDGFVYPAPVGSFLPNPWGLHDMQGNVTEWCRDVYVRSPTFRKGDGLNTLTSQLDRRSVRGGSYLLPATGFCRSAFRNRFFAGAQQANIGVRLARAHE